MEFEEIKMETEEGDKMSLLGKIKGSFRKPSVVSALIEFHHIEKEGDLWVDWTNEFAAGKQRVWEVIAKNGERKTKILEFGKEEVFGNLIAGRTIQSQIFTTFIFRLTDMNCEDIYYHIEPCDPYNRLGIKDLIILPEDIRANRKR